MVNPILVKKSEGSLIVNENTKRLFQLIYQEQNKDSKDNDDEPKINVSSFVSKMAFYYEKIRNSVDFKEDHLLRKNAIQRIIKRQVVIEGAISSREQSSVEVSKHLITELIRAGYLPNNKIPESKIDELAKVIEKYLKLKNKSLETLKHHIEGEGDKNQLRERNDLINWIIGILATDLEERLSYRLVNKTVFRDMFEILTKKIVLPAGSPFEEDRDIQIYLSIYRNYMKYDYGMLNFILFKYFNGNWEDPDDETIDNIALNILELQQAVEFQQRHPLSGQLNRIVNRYNVFFSILVDVISENPVSVYDSLKNDPKAFPRDIKKVCNKRYELAKAKLWRAAGRSIIYIFLTKSIFVILLEIPATTFFHEPINYMSLAINVSFPALLLFMVVFFTRLPSDENTAKITSGIEEIAFKNRDELEPITLRQSAKRELGISMVFSFFYATTFILSFGATIWLLEKINFNWVSIIIFLFFLAFVSFFTIRVRRGIKELMIVEKRESFLSFLLDFFYIPVAYTGKWLSEKFSRINVFVFLLDFVIEAPFKVVVEIVEEWTKYVKERKDNIS